MKTKELISSFLKEKLSLGNKQDLLKNNTGYSIKNWFLYGVTLVGILLLLVVGFVLIFDVLRDGKVDSSISELSGFIGSIAGLFVSAGLPKIVGEIVEFKNKNKENGTEEPK